jgi:DUF4097 and DUF4098 domain-containing protein YvlB
MTAYPTPQPIHMHLDLAVGNARITTGERDDTVVEVRPRHPDRDADVRAAQQTHVSFANGRLDVRTPRPALGRGPGWSVDVAIAAPAGSSLSGHTGLGDLVTEGPLGPVSFKSGAGRVQLDHAADLRLTSGAGDISVGAVDGAAAVGTGTGELEVGSIAGSASLKSGNGALHVGRLDGDARVRTGNGAITIGAAGASLDARTGHGNVRVGAVTRGSIGVSTSFGDVEIGIAPGTAARLDVRTHFGTVDQQLPPSDGPAAGAPVAKVHGRTGTGDVLVRRAAAPEAVVG